MFVCSMLLLLRHEPLMLLGVLQPAILPLFSASVLLRSYFVETSQDVARLRQDSATFCDDAER